VAEREWSVVSGGDEEVAMAATRVACGVLIGLGQGVWFGSGGQRIRADGGGEFWTTDFLVCG
jgi:hypothetical protein